MNTDSRLRTHIANQLIGGQAYGTYDEIIADFPQNEMNTVFPNGSYSPWGLLEHIRRTQADILNFLVNPKYRELNWPADYWPEISIKAEKKDWEETASRYANDLREIVKLVHNHKIDLFAQVPQGSGQTYLREFLLVSDHTSYHLGEFSIMRQVMKTWGNKHGK